MKFTWFNLMPWPYLPDDFRETAPLGLGRHPQHALRPPEGPPRLPRVHGPARVRRDALGFDGIGCNEHHQNGYGLMPSPNIIAAGLARRTSRAAICVIGNSIAGYNPPIRVAEEFAMLDVISGGRLVAGFPVGTPMDTNFCYGQIPALTRDKYREAHDLIMQAWAERRAVRLRRQVQPAPLGELLAQADPEAAPADLHPGRRLDRDLGLLPRPRLQLLVPLVLRLPARQVAAGRLLGAGGRARQGRVALPRRLRPDHLRGRHRRRGRAALRRALPLLLQPLPARLPGVRRPAGLPHDQHDQVRGAVAAPRWTRQKLLENLTWKDLVEERFIIAGSPDTVRQQLEE